MMTLARLLPILAVTLPLAACAAGQAPRAATPAAATVPASGQGVREGAHGSVVAPSIAPVTAAPSSPASASAPPSSAAPSSAAAASAAAGNTGADTAAAGKPAQSTDPALGSTPLQDTPASAANTPAAGTPAANAAAAIPPATATVPPTMPAASPTGSLMQTLFALVLVLAVLGALAWFLKRYGPKGGAGSANLRIVGSLNLGGRERLLVVEVGNQWIVVGASPGRVNALATMPRQDGADAATVAANSAANSSANPAAGNNATPAPHAPSASSFADWLKQTIDKRR